MSQNAGESDHRCKFCGEEDGLSHIAVMGKDADSEAFDYDEERILWLCENHYDKLTESGEYRVRELPEPVEVGHEKREEVDSNVVILVPENENKWFEAPQELELDLQDER